MEKTSIPYSDLFGIIPCTPPSPGIFELTKTSEHLNELGSIRASVVFTLAEISSSAFLVQHTIDLEPKDYIRNLRSADIKFRSTSSGPIYSIGKYSEREWKHFRRALIKNNRALIEFPIHVMNESGKCIAVTQFEWFVFRKPQRNPIK
jgi:hypothetical protein